MILLKQSNPEKIEENAEKELCIKTSLMVLDVIIRNWLSKLKGTYMLNASAALKSHVDGDFPSVV